MKTFVLEMGWQGDLVGSFPSREEALEAFKAEAVKLELTRMEIFLEEIVEVEPNTVHFNYKG